MPKALQMFHALHSSTCCRYQGDVLPRIILHLQGSAPDAVPSVVQLAAEWGLEPLEGQKGAPWTEEEVQFVFTVERRASRDLESKMDNSTAILTRRNVLRVSTVGHAFHRCGCRHAACLPYGLLGCWVRLFVVIIYCYSLWYH
jgi:hypothetical protein